MILIDPAVDILKKYFIFDKIFDLLEYDLDMEKLYHELKSLCRDNYEPNYRFIFLQYDTEYYITQESPGTTLINLQKILENLDISNYFCLLLSQQDLQPMCNLVKKMIAPNDACSINAITLHAHRWIHPDIEDINLGLNEESISSRYISLNGAGRFHRRVLLSVLKDRNLLDLGLVSYHGENYIAKL